MNLKNIGIQMSGKALLFINGLPPSELPETDGYQLIACTDGAFNYLKEMGFPLRMLDFISGDFDSHYGDKSNVVAQKFIYTPDQNKTDFEKALEILLDKDCNVVDVYGGSGGEMDHFLGNLTVAFLFKQKLKITFFDQYATYFFSPNELVLKGMRGKLLSLYPFPVATEIVTKGLKWTLNHEGLDITTRIGTRNVATEDTVTISFQTGALIIFVGLHVNFNGILK